MTIIVLNDLIFVVKYLKLLDKYFLNVLNELKFVLNDKIGYKTFKIGC